MINKNFLKSTEAIVVFGGLFMTLSFGNFWAVATAVAYLLLNAPNLWAWIKDQFYKGEVNE